MHREEFFANIYSHINHYTQAKPNSVFYPNHNNYTNQHDNNRTVTNTNFNQYVITNPYANAFFYTYNDANPHTNDLSGHHTNRYY